MDFKDMNEFERMASKLLSELTKELEKQYEEGWHDGWHEGRKTLLVKLQQKKLGGHK